MHRRHFLQWASVAASGAAQTKVPQSPGLRKSICSIIFPDTLPLAECFRRTKAAGFEGIELRLEGEIGLDKPADAIRRVGEQARTAGVTIVSLWVSSPLERTPLNHDDPAVRAQGVKVIEQAIQWASLIGCGALLLVPGRLGSNRLRFRYEDTWNRFTGELGKLIEPATRAQVLLTPENVWNKFLLSPLEMRAFVDQFHSPWLQTHFDVGNVMQYGFPEDWILTLGPRIKRVHFKDYKLSSRAEQGRFVDLLEGDVNWKDVIGALNKVGYHGFVSPEISEDPSDPEKLLKVSRSLDRILAMG